MSRINKSKSWFFESKNIDKLLANINRKKNTCVYKISNDKEEIILKTEEI